MTPTRFASQLICKSLSKHTLQQFPRAMATSKKIEITPENTGLLHVKQTESSAKKATELLQKDLEVHHVFFSDSGFHNHISHEILALYGSGAPPESMDKGFRVNSSYQRPMLPVHFSNPAEELQDWATAKKYLGKKEHYKDFLVFYQSEIDRLGSWERTLREHMFKGDERSEDMLVRMFAGIMHPIIQLMYGIEWNQPAIVAMGLAQAAVHDKDVMCDFLVAAEDAVAAASSSGKTNGTATPKKMPSVISLLEAVRAAERSQSDGDRAWDAGLKRAWDVVMPFATQVRVDPEELDERTAEMYHATIYEGAAAALARPDKRPKWDFFLIHHINLNPIFPAINAADWIPLEAKVRLLEWKIRIDLLQYAARECPELSFDRVASYEPEDKGPGADARLRSRIFALEDDGHAIKLFRAVAVGRQLITAAAAAEREAGERRGSPPPPWARIRGPETETKTETETWDRIAHLAVDSVEAPGPYWVRNAGAREAWDEIPDREA